MKKQLSVMIAAGMLSAVLLSSPVRAEDTASGTCGENCTWTLDDTGTLTINGTGNMYDYWSWSDVPWKNVCSKVTHIVVKDGITSIGNCAFECCYSAVSADIAASVKSIGYRSFCGCWSIPEITLPEGLETIHADAFYECSSLKELYVPTTVETIELGAFGIATLNDSLIAGKVDDTQTIYGYQGTGAEEYALGWGLNFKPMDEVVPGDVNGDGTVDAFDVAVLKQYLRDPENARIRLSSANLDGSSHSYHYKEYQNATKLSTADAVNEADLRLLTDYIMGKTEILTVSD